MKILDAFTTQYGKTYGIFVALAYLFFFLIGAIWVYEAHNLYGIVFTAFFAGQFYFRNKLANLISGVLILFVSIGTLLQSISATLSKSPYDASFLLWFSVTSIIFSVILMFSYMKAAAQKA